MSERLARDGTRVLLLLGCGLVFWAMGATGPSVGAQGVLAFQLYLPSVVQPGLPPLECSTPGPAYESLSVNDWQPPDRPADLHADLNLSLRGYLPTQAELGLVDYAGNSDAGTPQLPGLFADQRTPAFSAVYQVHDWDWGCNCRGALIESPEVTLAGLATTRGETIYLPDRQHGEIGPPGAGFRALLLYADSDSVTLKYSREDSVVFGYTLHLENICVDPGLLALYRSLDETGRHALPALRGGQSLGRALGSEIGVSIRDTGAFMDPRSRKDWWRGR